ncbi:hypothetical protein ACSTLI_23240, partial [Vibrio parahaemolyticus]
MKKLLMSILAVAGMAVAVVIGTASKDAATTTTNDKPAVESVERPQILPWVERGDNNFGGPFRFINRDQQQNGQYLP